MRQFWTLFVLGMIGVLVGTIGMALPGPDSLETSIEVSAPAPSPVVAPWVQL